jgi:hypothetical protein
VIETDQAFSSVEHPFIKRLSKNVLGTGTVNVERLMAGIDLLYEEKKRKLQNVLKVFFLYFFSFFFLFFFFIKYNKVKQN